MVLTGLDDETMANQALQAGAEDYLLGELEPRGLVRALRYAIERNIMQEALFAEKERAEVTLNSIGDAVVSSDIAGTITFLNVMAETMTGWPIQDALGQDVADVVRTVDAMSREATRNPMTAAREYKPHGSPAGQLHLDRVGWRDPDRRQHLADLRS